MNCKQLNTVPLEEVLRALGHLPTKQTEKEAWYLNPFAVESQASFKVDRRQNLWYLFSEGVSGTTTDFMRKYLNTSIKDVLQWASAQNFSSFQLQTIQAPLQNPNYRIDKVSDLQHPNLIRYLDQRGLSSKVYPYLKEVWFTLKDKSYYAIGFQNRSGGWELRNPYYKGSLMKKDISLFSLKLADPLVDWQINIPVNQLVEAPVGQLAIFEGFIDALSFIELKKSFSGDILILNSIALIKKAMEQIGEYSDIGIFLDKDRAGITCKNEILKVFPHAIDHSGIYEGYKDLNEYLVTKRQQRTLPVQKTEATQQLERGNAEQQDACKKETNNIKKEVRRGM